MQLKKCYVCKGEIKDSQSFESIGKGMYRHKFCYPGLPKNLNGTVMVVKEVVEEISEEPKKQRGRPKGSKNKEK